MSAEFAPIRHDGAALGFGPDFFKVGEALASPEPAFSQTAYHEALHLAALCGLDMSLSRLYGEPVNLIDDVTVRAPALASDEDWTGQVKFRLPIDSKTGKPHPFYLAIIAEASGLEYIGGVPPTGRHGDISQASQALETYFGPDYRAYIPTVRTFADHFIRQASRHWGHRYVEVLASALTPRNGKDVSLDVGQLDMLFHDLDTAFQVHGVTGELHILSDLDDTQFGPDEKAVIRQLSGSVSTQLVPVWLEWNKQGELSIHLDDDEENSCPVCKEQGSPCLQHLQPVDKNIGEGVSLGYGSNRAG